jgi:integrase
VLTIKEMQAYLDAFHGHILEPIIILALTAGLRRSELAGLTWADIDFDEKTVTITRGLHDHAGEVLIEEPKSDTSRRVLPLSDTAVSLLRPLRGIGPVCNLKPWQISSRYETRVRACELRRVQFKNLRHTHACLLLDAGVDLYTVSRRLGHSTTAVTEKHYLRPGEDTARQAVATFDRLINNG